MGKSESVRVFSSISPALFQQLDDMASQQNASKAKIAADAIAAYLNGNGAVESADLQQLKAKLQHYEATIKQDQQQIAFLQAQVAQLVQSLSQLALPKAAEAPSQSEPVKTPLWKRMKFWTWV